MHSRLGREDNLPRQARLIGKARLLIREALLRLAQQRKATLRGLLIYIALLGRIAL